MWIRQFLLLLALLVFTSTAMAQPFRKPSYDHRSDNWEVSLIAAWQKGGSKTYEGGSHIDVDDSTGWGFSAGYNFNAFLNVGFRFTSIEPRYDARIVPEDPELDPIGLSHKMTKNAGFFTGTWNFFSSSFTPFLQLGAGWAKVDSNVPSSSPTVGCGIPGGATSAPPTGKPTAPRALPGPTASAPAGTSTTPGSHAPPGTGNPPTIAPASSISTS
jgi:hypothetical protein